jgi:hypothetical protein
LLKVAVVAPLSKQLQRVQVVVQAVVAVLTLLLQAAGLLLLRGKVIMVVLEQQM